MIEKLSSQQASEIFNKSRRTVVRRVQSGRIKGTNENNRYLIESNEVLNAKLLEEMYQENSDLKFIVYSHLMTGVKIEDVAREFVNEDLDITRLVFNNYDTERERQMQGYGISSKEANQLVRGSEIMARLRVVDVRIPGKLLQSGFIDESEGMSGSGAVKPYYTLDSFVNYLGDYSNEILYRTDHAVEITGLKREGINRVAKKHGLGMKILDTPRSAYLFSLEEIERMPLLRR